MPEGYDQTGLPSSIRAELRSLTKQLADKVGGHLQAAAELLDVDPEQALAHAMVARRLASRLPVVREAAAETAYLAGHYDTALTEYRALHRITGDDDYLPIIADCERAVGKHQAALRTLREARDLKLSLPQQVEVILVEAGVRDDMGQRDEASRLLKEAISGGRGGRQGQARLRFAYADLLAEHGRPDAALEWLTSARTYDENNELEIDDRIAELKGEPVAEAPDLDEFEVLDVEEVDDVDDEPAEADDSQESVDGSEDDDESDDDDFEDDESEDDESEDDESDDDQSDHDEPDDDLSDEQTTEPDEDEQPEEPDDAEPADDKTKDDLEEQ